jgi:hypothetical protein
VNLILNVIDGMSEHGSATEKSLAYFSEERSQNRLSFVSEITVSAWSTI